MPVVCSSMWTCSPSKKHIFTDTAEGQEMNDMIIHSHAKSTSYSQPLFQTIETVNVRRKGRSFLFQSFVGTLAVTCRSATTWNDRLFL